MGAVGFRGRDQDFRIRGGARGSVDDIRTEILQLRAANGVNDEYHNREDGERNFNVLVRRPTHNIVANTPALGRWGGC